MSEPGLAPRFTVGIDGKDLGCWTKCEGLAVEYDMFEYQEGGWNDYVHRLRGRRKYPNVKLTRPLDGQTTSVIDWIFREVKHPRERGSAQICVLDGNGQVVCRWHLDGVCPVKWTGPSLDAAGNQIANETLELAHNGFRVTQS